MASPFLFQTSFDGGGQRPKAARVVPNEEAEAAKAAARAEGFAAGYAQAQAEAAVRASEAIARIADGVSALLAQAGQDAAAVRRDAMQVAHGVAQKLSRGLVERQAGRLVESVLDEVLRERVAEPRIVVRADGPVIDSLRAELERVTTAAGYPGGVVLIPDPDLQGADCRVEWADGGAEYRFDDIAGRVDAAIRAALTTPQNSVHG